MADNPEDDKVKIHAPDRTLHTKLGYANLDEVFSPQTVAMAQQIIVRAADTLQAESVEELGTLEHLASSLQASPTEAPQILPAIAGRAFSIKTKAGLGGFDLVVQIAASLHVYCERLDPKAFTPKDMTIIQWHIQSIAKLLREHIKGAGGELGETILAELKRLVPPNKG